MYRITVEKLEKLELTREQTEALKRGDYLMGSCSRKVISVDLTDEEFAAVKKAVLGVM